MVIWRISIWSVQTFFLVKDPKEKHVLLVEVDLLSHFIQGAFNEKEDQNELDGIVSSYKRRKGCYQNTTLTSLADEQGTNEARVVVLHHVLVGDVGVGEAVGIVRQWGNLWRHLPVVNVFIARLHNIVLFFFL